MWSKIMGFTSFVVVPIVFICVVFTGLRAVFFLEWKPFLISLIILIMCFIAEFVFSTLMD